MSDLGGKNGENGNEDGASSKGTPSPKGATIPFDYSKLTIPLTTLSPCLPGVLLNLMGHITPLGSTR
jgi:hypothetical protein